MAPRNRFVTEYKASFTQHEVNQLHQQQIRHQDNILNDNHRPVQDGAEKRKSEKSAMQNENRALRYKAGFVPSMPTQNKIRYLSEYQKQFEWKRPVEPEVPILSAEKLVYGGQDGNPSRATKIDLPKKTEYQLQFIRHPLITSPDRKEKDQNKGQYLQSYSPVGYHDAQIAAGKPSKKPPPLIATKKSMVFQSEYHANFKSPSKYDYVSGSWVGADPPQFHPPDEQSDNGVQPASSSWYQQVLELREKVESYRSRAREGSHFLSLLKDLKSYKTEASKGCAKPSNDQKSFSENTKLPPSEPVNLPGHPKSPPSEPTNLPGHPKSPPSEPANLPGHPKSPPSEPANLAGHPKSMPSEPANLPGHTTSSPCEPSRNSTPVKATQLKQEENARTGAQYLVDKGDLHGMPMYKRREDKREILLPASDDKASEEDKLLRNKNPWIPGPSIKKTPSLESISNESTITNPRGGKMPDEQTSVGRRHAWPDCKPDYRRGQLVVPPYHTSESSNGNQNDSRSTRSDVTIEDMEGSSVVDERQTQSNDKREQGTTQKLFNGRRAEVRNDRNRWREYPYNEKPMQATRKLITAKRRDFSDGRRRSLSSDDDMSCGSRVSFLSNSNSVLSVDAMDKRRALASETLQRAKRRQAQL